MCRALSSFQIGDSESVERDNSQSSRSGLCKIVVYTDGGAAFRPGEGPVASWGFVAVLMCGNKAVCDWLCVRASCAGQIPP